MSTPKIDRLKPDTELTPDEQPRAVPMTPAQTQAADAEKAALLEAMRLPAAAVPRQDARDGGDTTTGRTVRITLADPARIDVAAGKAALDAARGAVAEQEAKIKAAEADKAAREAELEQARVQLGAAEDQVRADAKAQAQTTLAPLAAKLVTLQRDVQRVLDTYGGHTNRRHVGAIGPLGELSTLIAAGWPVQRREKLQSLYRQAAPLAARIVAAYQRVSQVLTRAEQGIAQPMRFNDTEAIARACQDVLTTTDVPALETACRELLAEVSAVRENPNWPTAPVLAEPHTPTRAPRVTPAPINTTWQP